MNDIPADWTWERFFVVDGGNGLIALWSAIHNRFVRMNANGNMDGSGHMGRDNLPADWTWERFSVVDGGNGQIALHSAIHNRFVRLNADGNMDTTPPTNRDALPADWTWERWSVKITIPPPTPAAPPPPPAMGPLPIGAEVALHSSIHNRFMRLHSNGNMDGSGHMARDNLPADWTWERFSVVDAGNGQIALHCPIHNRFVRLNANGNMDTTPPT